MTENRYTPRQLQIIRGEIPSNEIITAEYTRILKWAKEVGDDDVIEVIQPFRDERTAHRKRVDQKNINLYTTRHYDRITCFFPKGMRDQLKAYAKENGTSVNNIIVSATCEKVGLKL